MDANGIPGESLTSTPKTKSDRGNDADLAILLFSHTPKSIADWRKILIAEDDHSLRPIFREAIAAERVSLRRYQGLDGKNHDRNETEHFRVLEILLDTGGAYSGLQACIRLRQHDVIRAWELENAADVICQPTSLYLSRKPSASIPGAITGLVVFDMDSTLIQQEVIDELARKVGLYDAVSAITEAAMRGEEPYTDFAASLRARVSLLKDVPLTVWDELKRDTISFTPGARELLRVLRNQGWKTAVLSGGFTPLANWVKETLGLDHAFANHLVEDASTGTLTGELVAGKPIIDGAKKKQLLLELAQENSIPVERVIAIGDGSNDLPMMHAAGFGIAFNAKPKVQLAAPARLNSTTLLDVLYVLGYNGQEISSLLGDNQSAIGLQ